VPVELSQLAAAFPFAASFAIAGGFAALREGRRRAALNEAMHELRRPLQVLALSLPSDPATAARLDSSLRLAAAAADRLDSEINGESGLEASQPIAVRPLAEAAVDRWQARAQGENRLLALRWMAGDPTLRGSSRELAQALDNLISNGFEHGSGNVLVEGFQERGVLRLVVRDSGSSVPATGRRGGSSLATRLTGRGRHGHGLKIVRRTVARHGGSFDLLRGDDGAEAVLRLPLTGAER
jgi:signal transduction histidine kinase